MKSGHLALEMDGHTMMADSAPSKFYHKIDSTLKIPSQSEYGAEPGYEGNFGLSFGH